MLVSRQLLLPRAEILVHSLGLVFKISILLAIKLLSLLALTLILGLLLRLKTLTYHLELLVMLFVFLFGLT